MYFLSEENRADGPTRDSVPAEPDLSPPRWLSDLQDGSVGAFDEYISRLPADQQLNPFDFTALMNGKKLDIKPRSQLQGTQKKKYKKLLKQSADASHSDVPRSQPVDPSTFDIIKEFDDHQFFFEGDAPDFSLPRGLDLFSGNCGVAKEMVRAGCPWVLTFDWARSSKEDLLCPELREKLVKLIHAGWFGSVGMAPICASFSPAITPPVRSRRFLRGKPGVSPAMRKKISQGNSHCDFCRSLILLCLEKGLAYFLENPDRSWLWKQKGYEDFENAASGSVFRLAFCRFGTPWQKNTRIATSTRLRSLRMPCLCKQKHLALRGYSRLHKKCWTKVAEPYPRGLAKLLGTALCAQAGWCEQKRLNVSGCCRCGSMRVGEAKNPGP